MTKSAIYQPTGLAAENSKLALNIFDGCIHGCKYCYVPLVRHIPREKFHQGARPRLTLDEIEACAAKWTGEKTAVNLCFTTDPYQPDPVCCAFTRATIEILHRYGFAVSILTKGGVEARHDLDLFRPGDIFGQTIMSLDPDMARQWEPGAAPPEERLANLREAKLAGIDTYISLEPVIAPAASLEVIEASVGFTDHYKVGPLNYYAGDLPVPAYDRAKFVRDAVNLVHIKYKRGIHVKKSFAAAVCGGTGGIRMGVQLP